MNTEFKVTATNDYAFKVLFASEPYTNLSKCISIMVLNDSFEYADDCTRYISC